MAAETVESGASLFRRECVGFGLGVRVHSLSRREEPRAARSVSHPQLDTAAKRMIHGALWGLGARGKSARWEIARTSSYDLRSGPSRLISRLPSPDVDHWSTTTWMARASDTPRMATRCTLDVQKDHRPTRGGSFLTAHAPVSSATQADIP